MSRNKLFSTKIAIIILTSIVVYMPLSQLLFVHAQDNQDSSFTIATTGDISCSDHAKKTIREMGNISEVRNKTPDLVLWLGDLSHSSPFECFTELTSKLHDEGEDIAVIGNHDDEGEDGDDEIRSQVIDHFNLGDGYWSRPIDIPNNNQSNDILLVGMNSQSNIENDSRQYKFVKSQLETSTAPLKIVAIHKPFLTCECKHGTNDVGENDQFDTYHSLFRNTGVDLVLQGHNHNVQYYDLIDNVKYVVSGAGGTSHFVFGDEEGDEIPMPKPTHFKDDRTFGFTLIEADFVTNQLTGKFITNNGNAIADSQFNHSFGGVPQQPSNERFTVDVGKGEGIFIPSNQRNANVTIAVDEGIVVLPKP